MRLFYLILLVSAWCSATHALNPNAEPVAALDNLLIVQSGGGSGCSWFDPLDLCDIGEKAIEKLLDALPGITNEIKDAVMQVVDELFNKIGGVMEKFEAAVLRIEKQSVDDAKKLIAQVEAAIKAVTDEIVAKVKELIKDSVAEITAACEAIIKDVSNLVDSIFSQVTTILHEVEQVMWEALCTGEGMIKQIELFISASSMTSNQDACDCVHDAAVWAVDACASTCTCTKGIFKPFKCSCGVAGWATVEDQNLYYAIRCKAEKEVEKGIAQNKTANWIATKLGSIADLGLQLQCYHFNSAGTIGDWYATQALELIKVINIWVPPSNDRIKRLKQQSQNPSNNVLINQVQSLVAAVHLQTAQIDTQQKQIDNLKHELDTLRQSQQVPKMVNEKVPGADCTTAFDCWTEALQRLQAAQRMVDDALNQTRMAEDKWIAANSTFALRTTVEANTNDIVNNRQDIATNTQDVTTNTQDVATNTQDVATNTQGVAINNAGWTGLSSTVSGLSVGLCNVQQFDIAGKSIPDGYVMIIPGASCTGLGCSSRKTS